MSQKTPARFLNFKFGVIGFELTHQNSIFIIQTENPKSIYLNQIGAVTILTRNPEAVIVFSRHITHLSGKNNFYETISAQKGFY
jgi:hypothetical protein